MEPIFKESNKQLFFERNGFVKTPLLSAEKADELWAFFQENRLPHASVSDLHHTTTDTGNRELILEVDAKIKQVFLPELEKVLIDFKPLAATYHIKESGKGSHTGIHQDPTFVDETRYHSLNVWVALHDVNEENGNLYFVPGSHSAVHSIRSVPSYPNYYAGFMDKVADMMVPVPLKKGEAVIFSNATIHSASENLTDEIRLGATLLVCSKPADWILYYRDEAKPDWLDLHELDLETFIKIGRGEKPQSQASQVSIHGAFPQLNHEEFICKSGQKISRFARLKNLFRKSHTA